MYSTCHAGAHLFHLSITGHEPEKKKEFCLLLVGFRWRLSGPNPYWMTWLTTEEVLLVLVHIELLRQDVWNTVQVHLVWYLGSFYACWRGSIKACLGDKEQIFVYYGGGKYPYLNLTVAEEESIIVLVHRLFVAVELQVEADPHLPCRHLMKQKTTCHCALVFKLFLYGCDWYLSPTQKVWQERR